MSHFMEQYPPITNLKTHLVARVEELREVLQNTWVDRFIVKGTLQLNVEIYETIYGEFPNKESIYKELQIQPKKPVRVNIGEFYVH